MYGTSLGGIEQLMMLAPNFTQRRSLLIIILIVREVLGFVMAVLHRLKAEVTLMIAFVLKKS